MKIEQTQSTSLPLHSDVYDTLGQTSSRIEFFSLYFRNKHVTALQHSKSFMFLLLFQCYHLHMYCRRYSGVCEYFGHELNWTRLPNLDSTRLGPIGFIYFDYCSQTIDTNVTSQAPAEVMMLDELSPDQRFMWPLILQNKTRHRPLFLQKFLVSDDLNMNYKTYHQSTHVLIIIHSKNQNWVPLVKTGFCQMLFTQRGTGSLYSKNSNLTLRKHRHKVAKVMTLLKSK